MVGSPTGRVDETVGVGQRVGQRISYVQFCAWVFSLHVLNLINTDQQDKTKCHICEVLQNKLQTNALQQQ